MKSYKIILKSSDIKNDRTDTGLLIDKIAMSLGQSTENEVIEDACEDEKESYKHTLNNFDYEEALIDFFEREPLEAWSLFVKGDERDIIPDREEVEKQKLKAGAYIALTWPELWERMLQDYTETVEEFADEYNDDGGNLAKFAPALMMEIRTDVDDFWKIQRKEWLYGDYGNWSGIIPMFAKELGVERDHVVYDEKKDVMTITFSSAMYHDVEYSEAMEFFSERYSDGDDSKPQNITAKELKNCIVEDIYHLQENEYAKQLKEREERIMTRKRQKEYEAEQVKEAEAKRAEKLKKMKK